MFVQSLPHLFSARAVLFGPKAVAKPKATPPAFKPTASTVLVIVESPNKIKLIESYLRPLVEKASVTPVRVRVLATLGHFMEIADIRLNERFNVKWQLMDDKRETISSLREAISHPLISEIVLASDPDREGELIAAHIKDALFPKNLAARFSRAYFYAMTNTAITEGFTKRQPDFIDTNLVESALARHILDRMFGFTASTALMMHNEKCRSIGRVQTPALLLIHRREAAIQEYEKRGVTYSYSIEPQIAVKKANTSLGKLKGALCDAHAESYAEEKTCASKREELAAMILGTNPTRLTVKETAKSKTSNAPFTMVTLIETASRILKMKGDAVTNAAQTLFTKGLITYPRSDSERLAEDFEVKLASYISKKFGEDMCFTGKKVRRASSNAEGAHEAIRPTDMNALPSTIPVEDSSARALYALIHDCTVACRMQPVVTKTVQATLSFRENIEVRVSQSYIHEFGYMKALEASIVQDNPVTDQSEQRKKFDDLKGLKAGDVCLSALNIARHSDSKPARLTEGALVTALKSAGIGRPSTYAATLQKLNERGYSKFVEGKAKLSLGPNGEVASAYAMKQFQRFVQMDFTGEMEAELNDIANGKKQKVDVVKKFWAELKSCLPYRGPKDLASVQCFTQAMRRVERK